ncbi:NUDIX-domain-containing protein [Mytilinidion resinicola]|uniref:NUDIX-domain-containing protein n=1 Tax=Mytilinidion resinicola TaxID=574789 RepID=A0A6A6YPX5_9PEZI|nr:NUDIX-domain-containing protein [Mytilinidion resinicola]KAF2810578.1 NUDIX-domain-containing protein [Mytilinidion resinicola]
METGTEPLVAHLKDVLLDLAAHPFPEVANPPTAPRRASVALILRIQPHYSHWPAAHSKHAHAPSHGHRRRRSSAASNPEKKLELKDILDAFFAQDWVKHGDPELLFIKRATRAGDNWNGHVALPGGKRDPEDEDDQVTAVREAMEEVGVDLSYAHAIAIGNLPQRVVTTSWGKVPLMVLCPYIFLLTSPSIPPLRLQPTEVASTHWVSLRALLSPAQRTFEYADVSQRLAKAELGIKRWFLQSMLGQMMFAAVRLLPSESTYCSSIPGFIPESEASTGVIGSIKGWWTGDTAARRTQKPLLLWGLTLGVISDLLEHIPPHKAMDMWTYPTFTSWDVRVTLWAMSYRFRKQKAIEMGQVTESSAGAEEDTEVPKQDPQGMPVEKEPGEVGIGGLGVGRHWGRSKRDALGVRGSAVNSTLEGYYPIVRKAVATALVGRVSLTALLLAYAWSKYRVRR